MGSDFDESQSLKIAGSGFMDISFGFADKVIPLGKLIRLDAKVAAEASEPSAVKSQPQALFPS